MIEFPEVASVVALTQADGVSQLSATATGLEDTGSGCFVAVTSQDTPFPASRVGVATLEFRGVTCPGIGPAAQQIFGRALDEPMSSHMTMDLVQDTSYVDVFGMGSECWTGTVSVEFSDHVIAPLDLSGMSSLDLRGTLTFTGGVLRAYNR